MLFSRREALAQLAALVALPLVGRVGPIRGQTPRAQPEGSHPLVRGDLHFASPLDGTIAAYQAGRARGQWTAARITAEALERCHAEGMRWRAIDQLATNLVAIAHESDLRLRKGRLFGMMDGVPVFAKSIYDMNGLRTTGSNAEWGAKFHDVLRRDALEVTRLRAAGAVVLGKTAADDFAYHGNGTSSLTGQVLNPHDPTGTRTPGGSSAGSAVAVADGMAFAALGTDDGGSNRIPAQFTGVVGMKPPFGLVARSGVIPTWPYLDTHGPLARSVADAAQMLAVIAGADPGDPLTRSVASNETTLGTLPALRDDALAGVRLGVVESHVPRAQMTAEAVATWDRAVDDLRAAGATVEVFDAAVTRVNYRDLFAEAAKARNDVDVDPKAPAPTANALYRYFTGRVSDPRMGDPKLLVRNGYAAYRSFYDVLPATFEGAVPLFDRPMVDDPAGRSFALSRESVVRALGDSMRAANVVAMVYPTMPFNAPKAVDPWPDIRTPLGYGNWLGIPEVSVPAGYGADGMPALNVSIVGLPGEDARVLSLAHAYEQKSRRFRPPPR
jgi:Asp-tRNA(Asn)/Glu-tRNA(Gln) amidotransferase A subunit family amidase